jgi:hypothetical protein
MLELNMPAPKKSHWKVTLISVSIALVFFAGIIVNHYLVKR